jgi:hypothetical protein
VKKVFGTPNRQEQRRTTERHIIVKRSGIQNKGRILKATKEKHQVTHKGKTIRITADFSTENLKARRPWNDIF